MKLTKTSRQNIHVVTTAASGPTVYDLPVPLSLRDEWKRLATRRHFLGRMGKTLGWAGLAVLMGDALFGRARAAETALPGPGVTAYRISRRRQSGAFIFSCPVRHRRWICGTTSRTGIPVRQGSAGFGSRESASDRNDRRPGPFSDCAVALGVFADRASPAATSAILLPWTGKLVDDITLVHTMQTDAINHEPAILLINTGNMVPGKPSLGSWLAYGLGSMNENLPTFVVLNSDIDSGHGSSAHFAEVVEQRISCPTNTLAWRFGRRAHRSLPGRSAGDEPRNAARTDRHRERDQSDDV